MSADESHLIDHVVIEFLPTHPNEPAGCAYLPVERPRIMQRLHVMGIKRMLRDKVTAREVFLLFGACCRLAEVFVAN